MGDVVGQRTEGWSVKHTSSAALGETIDAAALSMDWDIVCVVVIETSIPQRWLSGSTRATVGGA